MNPTDETPLNQLAQTHGIDSGYTNIWGEYHETPSQTLEHVLSEFGMDVEAAGDQGDAAWRQWTEPVRVVRQSDGPVKVRLQIPKQDGARVVSWKLYEENGSVHSGQFTQADLTWQEEATLSDGGQVDAYLWQIPVSLPWGYHLVSFRDEGETEPLAEMAVIITPDTCFLPSELDEGRVWGPAVQLYSIRSKRNWGMGDFTDLKNLTQWCGEQGAGILGVNPLHELFPHQSAHKSPYSPSSRSYFNTLYLDVEALEDFEECAEVQALVSAPTFQARIEALRELKYVDYEQVAQLKRPMLELLFDHFKNVHIEGQTPRGNAFEEFCAEQGRWLEEFVVFQALHEYHFKQDMNHWSWQGWDERYVSPEGEGVHQFSQENKGRVQYYMYLQWQAHLQLQTVKDEAAQYKMPAGLYLDLAVGSDISGAEVWSSPELFALNTNVGCPPDECNQKGQDWGLPPMLPEKLKAMAYAPFIRILRRNMGYAGALRIDHVMGLMRLFWIPKGQAGTDGTYVHYAFDDLLGILALESHRNACLVIGENLGTVPERVQEKMDEWRILSYKVFFFERHSLGTFKLSHEYPKQALVALSTHDLPTITGFWESEDIRVREELDLYPNERFRTEQVNNRVLERQGIMQVLQQEQLLPETIEWDGSQAVPDMTPELAHAVHAFLSRTPCGVCMVQLEDVFEQPKQVNLPGTVDQYPNWQRKITVDLEDWSDDPRMEPLLKTMKQSYERQLQTS